MNKSIIFQLHFLINQFQKVIFKSLGFSLSKTIDRFSRLQHVSTRHSRIHLSDCITYKELIHTHSPWFFFQTAVEPGGEFGADAGDLVCVWCWLCVSGGSRAAGPARLSDKESLEVLFLSWSWPSSTGWEGRLSWLDKKGEQSSGAAESDWGGAAGKEVAGFGIWKRRSCDLNTEFHCGGFWSTTTEVMFGRVSAAGTVGTGSEDLVLPRGTLAQVCRWVRRPR